MAADPLIAIKRADEIVGRILDLATVLMKEGYTKAEIKSAFDTVGGYRGSNADEEIRADNDHFLGMMGK